MAAQSVEQNVALLVLVPIIAGLLSLLGAFAGAFLARRTEYEKWRRERRSEVYTRFLELMDDASEKTTSLLHDTTLQPPERDIEITEVYAPALNYIRVVRLYLPKSKREEFQRLAKDVWALHTDPELGDSRLQTAAKRLDQIQEIFESNL